MSNDLKPFNFEAIAQINEGELLTELNRTLHQAFLDCADRPGVPAARKVTLTISLKPEIEGTHLGKVYTDFVVQKAFPSKGVTVAMKAGPDGLVFRPEVPDNPDQQTLGFDGDDDDSKGKR